MTFSLADTRGLGALGGLLTGVGFFGGVAAAKATEKSPYPRPGAEPEEVQKYFTESSTAARLSAAGLAASSAALAGFTASVAGVAGRSGSRARALQAAAIAGGGLAVATQTVSAAASAALTRGRNDLARTGRLRQVAFLSGGPAHGVGLGVLTGVLGLAGLRSGELGRPLAVASLAFAPVNILGPLTLAAKPTMVALPIGHAAALVVSGIAGVRLARRPR
jgi:hypothetical protein